MRTYKWYSGTEIIPKAPSTPPPATSANTAATSVHEYKTRNEP